MTNPTRELTPEQKIKSNKLSKKIKILKGLEIACLSGMIAGAGVMITSGSKGNDKVAYISAGIYAISVLGESYSYNKRKYYQMDKHWLDNLMELDYVKDKKNAGEEQ